MTEEKIHRINELYKKKKEGTLTPEEKEEQAALRAELENAVTEARNAYEAALRAEYVQAVRNNLRATLENTSIQEPDGTIHKLQKKGTP